jgi:hypothetical protein
VKASCRNAPPGDVVVVVELVVVEVVEVDVVPHVHEVVVIVEPVVELVVELVVVLVVELVVVEVVVVVTGQLGSPGCPVQVQSPALHWARRFLVHVLAAIPVNAPHAALISSAQDFLLHAGGGAAVATEETKTPAPRSATAANVTTTFLVLVIVRSLCGRSDCATSVRRAVPAAPFRARPRESVKGF